MRALTNFLCAMRTTFSMTGKDTLLAVTTISFDGDRNGERTGSPGLCISGIDRSRLRLRALNQGRVPA